MLLKQTHILTTVFFNTTVFLHCNIVLVVNTVDS